MEVTLNSLNFKEQILKSTIPALVDFWAPWCGPCHVIAPSVAQIAEEYQGKLVVGKLNVDENPNIAADYQVRSIPTLKIFKAGKVVDEIIGAVGVHEIKKRVEKNL